MVPRPTHLARAVAMAGGALLGGLGALLAALVTPLLPLPVRSGCLRVALALRPGPAHDRSLACLQMALRLEGSGFLRLADRWYRRGFAVDPAGVPHDYPLALLHHADVLVRQGRLREARLCWEQVARATPTDRNYQRGCRHLAKERLALPEGSEPSRFRLPWGDQVLG